MNPNTELLSWLQGLEPEIKTDIAFLVGTSMPDAPDARAEIETGDAMAQSFIARVAKHSEGHPTDVGFMLAFIAVFDFMLVRTRGTAEAWKRPKAMFEGILASTDPKFDILKESARSSVEELPGRSAKWIAVCDEWAKLKAGPLSAESLEAWADDSFRQMRDQLPKP